MASVDDFPAYLDVDPEQGFKAQKIKILSCFAPTMVRRQTENNLRHMDDGDFRTP